MKNTVKEERRVYNGTQKFKESYNAKIKNNYLVQKLMQ